MKTKKALIATGLFILFLSGCIPSIHSLYHEEDLVFKNELLGEWREGDENIWVFEGHPDDKSYTLTYFEEAQPFKDSAAKADFEVHLVKLGDYYFLDLYPGSNDHLNMPSLLINTLLPVHIFARAEFIDDQVRISFFDPDWLEKLIDENRIRISHEKTDEYYVLTASTDELQRFVLKYADSDEAFLEASILSKSE